jgi:Gas vesicle synthesis protein GvpL/GvpF
VSVLLYAIGENHAFVDEWNGPPPEPTVEALEEHEQIVSRLMEQETVLPVRFGTVLEDEDEVSDLLRDRRDELHDALDRVRGAVEIGVRVTWRVPDVATGSGAEYLRSRLEVQRRADDLARRLDPLSGLARGVRHRVLPRASEPVVAAYLVDRARVEEFTSRVAELDRELGDVELVCTGPWPPYSFAEGASA